MIMNRLALVAATMLCCVFSALADEANEAARLLKQAQEAWAKRDTDKAMELVNKAITTRPDQTQGYYLRGLIFEVQGKHEAAVTDFTKCVLLDPKHAEAFNHRGSEQFKRGRINESLADFDRFLALRPEEKPGHWKRGISLYYAGNFEEGQKQFEGYEKVDTNDVENAVWHFLCAARRTGVGMAKAREGILKIGKDKRVPMMQVYDLYRGKLKPEEVLAAAEAGEATDEQRRDRLFYAHLYLGLYYDAAGDKKKALEHLTLAAGKYRIGHYMGDVARVHEELLRKENK
jgi:lipoprotein NlpI